MFPDEFPSSAEDVVRQLLVIDPQKRLGPANTIDGSLYDDVTFDTGAVDFDDLKRHRFFDGIEWECLRESTPPAWIHPKSKTDEQLSELNWELTSWANPFEQR